MPGLPSLPSMLTPRRSSTDELKVNKGAVSSTSKQCWSDQGQLPGLSKEPQKPLAGNQQEGAKPLQRSGSLASVASVAKLRTPRTRSCEVQAFDGAKAPESDEESSSRPAEEVRNSESVPQLQLATPRRSSSRLMSLPRASVSRAASAARAAARSSLPSPRPAPSPRRMPTAPPPQSAAREKSQGPAAREEAVTEPEVSPVQRPAGAETPRTSKGSIMRQLTPRRLIPKLWKSCEEGETRAETPRSARGSRSVATPARNQSGSQSARCSPPSDSKASRSAPSAPVKEAAEGDNVEVDALTRKMLAAVYEQPLAEEQAAVVLGICPEVSWLVQCTLRSPLPPGWRQRSNGSYVNSETGEKSALSPILDSFAKLARLALHARQAPSTAATAAAWVRRARDDALKKALRQQDEWTGPHLDESAGAEYYHNSSTGTSTWSSPFAPDMYLAHVADRLLQSEAFPTRSSEDPTLEDVAAEIQTARQAQKSARASAPRPASAMAKTSSSRLESREESDVKPCNESPVDAAAALAGAAAAVAAAAAALTGQGTASGSQDGAGALANAAAALTAAVQLSSRGERPGLGREKEQQSREKQGEQQGLSKCMAEPVQSEQKGAEAVTSDKPQDEIKADPGAEEATPATTASSGKEPPRFEILSQSEDESESSESEDESASAAPAGPHVHLTGGTGEQKLKLAPVEVKAPAVESSTRGTKKPISPLSSEAALKLAFELTTDEQPKGEKPAEISSLLGGNGARPAVPKLTLAKPLPGPPPRPSAAPAPEDSSSSSSSEAPLPPAPQPAAARTVKKDSKIKAAPAPPTSAADLFSKGNRTSCVGGA